jgi:hypothetical protein
MKVFPKSTSHVLNKILAFLQIRHVLLLKVTYPGHVDEGIQTLKLWVKEFPHVPKRCSTEDHL